jgi:hypothetical protein
MATTPTLSTRVPATAPGTTQDPARAIETSGGLDVTTAYADADALDIIVVPAPLADRKGVAQLGPWTNTLLEFSIGHATTPVAKTATVYIVGVREKLGSNKEPIVYKRNLLGQVGITGDRALVAGELSAHASKFSGFQAWATCQIAISADYTPSPPGMSVIGTGAADNAPELLMDTFGYSFLEIWVVNGAADQGVVVDYRQC